MVLLIEDHPRKGWLDEDTHLIHFLIIYITFEKRTTSFSGPKVSLLGSLTIGYSDSILVFQTIQKFCSPRIMITKCVSIFRSRNWLEAVKWYNKSILTAENEEDDSTEIHSDPLADEPVYLILSRMAAMYLEGGYSLEKDPQKAGDLYTEAAESAMNAMKGKLSTKYYMLAEEAWAEVEDE